MTTIRSTLPAVLAFVLTSSALAVSTLTGVGFLPGKTVSIAAGVSNDGQIVVGRSSNNSGTIIEAFKWTPAGGMNGLGFLPGGSISLARAVSKDGSVIVGDATSTAAQPSGGTEGFRHVAGVMSGLHTPIIMGQAFACSANGATVVADAVWTAATGVQLNVIPYFGFGISNDASVVVGRSSGFVAQRWTAGTGKVDLPNTSGVGVFSVANAVSGDGLVAVGNRNNVACYWSVSGGFVSIGTPGVISTALAVNFDGSIIVGRRNSPTTGATEAFVWTPTDGLRTLESILTAQGVDLSAWLYQGKVALVEATGLSDDGQYLVGNGVKQGFLVHLDFTPLSAIQQWRVTYFGTSANTGAAADTADPDGDGIPNFIEYALGTIPTAPSTTGYLAPMLTSGQYSVGFNRIADPAMIYSIESTATLTPAVWVSIWSSTGAANTAGPTTVDVTSIVSAQDSYYFRLKVTR